MAGPRKTTAISIRFEENQKIRLRTIASGLRMKPSDVIRLAVEQLLDDVTRSGKVVVPIRMREKAVLEDPKGYTSKAKKKVAKKKKITAKKR